MPCVFLESHMYRPDSWKSERARLAYLTRHNAPEADITEALSVLDLASDHGKRV